MILNLTGVLIVKRIILEIRPHFQNVSGGTISGGTILEMSSIRVILWF